MTRRRLVVAALVAGAAALGLVGVQLLRSERRALGKGAHFVTLVARSGRAVSPLGSPSEIVEQWIQFSPLKWKADVYLLSVPSRAHDIPGSAVAGPPLHFVFDGQQVVLLVDATGEAHVLGDVLAATVRSAERPLILEDLLPGPAPTRSRAAPARGSLVLDGDTFSSVLLERDRTFAADFFEIPVGYRHAGTVGTPQELLSAAAVGWPGVSYGPGREIRFPSLAALQEAVRIDPTSADAHFSLAMALWTIGRSQEAQREFHRCAELDPSSPAPHNALGAFHESEGRPQEAIGELEIAVQLAPEDSMAWENLARLYRAVDEPEKARLAEQNARQPASASRPSDR